MTRCALVGMLGVALILAFVWTSPRASAEPAWQNVERELVRVSTPSHDDLEAASSGSRPWRVRFVRARDVELRAFATNRFLR